MDNICSDTNVIYIVSGIKLTSILPVGLQRMRSCCPAFVFIPVYELSGTFSIFIAKMNLSVLYWLNSIDK